MNKKAMTRQFKELSLMSSLLKKSYSPKKITLQSPKDKLKRFIYLNITLKYFGISIYLFTFAIAIKKTEWLRSSTE